MSTPMDTYRHLDKSEPLTLTWTMEEVAQRVDETNYGLHRFLSATIRLRRARFAEHGYPSDKAMADALEAILERGLF